MSKRGKFISLLGINNTGKSTQRDLLAERLHKSNLRVFSTKYAQYQLRPTGSILDGYLRAGNPHNLSPREFQTIQAMNRTQFEPRLKSILDAGVWVVAEDYTGTGIAWGVGAGVDEDYLIYLNSHLIKEDISILFDGERFNSGIEKDHVHESKNDLVERVRQIHLGLAKRHNWIVVNANRSKNDVHQEIWGIIQKKFGLDINV